MSGGRKKDALSGQSKTNINLSYNDDGLYYLLNIIVTGIDTIQTTRNVHPTKDGMDILKQLFDQIPKDIKDHYKLDNWITETEKLNESKKNDSNFGLSDVGFTVDSISEAKKSVHEPYR